MRKALKNLAVLALAGGVCLASTLALAFVVPAAAAALLGFAAGVGVFYQTGGCE